MKKLSVGNLVCYLLLILLAFVFLAPFLFTLFTSVKANEEIYANVMTILPKRIVIDHYQKVFTQMSDFFRYFYNTSYVTLFSLALVVVLSATTGYTFGMLPFKGMGVFMGFIILVLTLPYAIYLIPIYLMQDQVGLINTHWGLILPYTAINLPMSILIMRGHFRSVPRELMDACIVDGCGYFRAWIDIMLPIVKPGLAVVAILTFINTWGEFMFAQVLTNTSAAQTLSVGITFLRDEAASWQFGTLSAVIVLSLLPPLAIFLAMQKYFVAGITEGALKG